MRRFSVHPPYPTLPYPTRFHPAVTTSPHQVALAPGKIENAAPAATTCGMVRQLPFLEIDDNQGELASRGHGKESMTRAENWITREPREPAFPGSRSVGHVPYRVTPRHTVRDIPLSLPMFSGSSLDFPRTRGIFFVRRCRRSDDEVSCYESYVPVATRIDSYATYSTTSLIYKP